jgi:protoporphyrinogen IX oxidase
MSYYLALKALHIIFFTSWFAGLFYLPRIYVNLAMVKDEATYQHLLVMATKLYRFITPFMYITIGLGAWMVSLNTQLLDTGWLQIKLLLVILLITYHFICGNYLKKFQTQDSCHDHVFYRFFNEFPVFILVAIVWLAVNKSL